MLRLPVCPAVNPNGDTMTNRASEADRTRQSAHAVGLAEWFERQARRCPARPAITFEDSAWTYSEFQREIERVATILAAGGIRQGDRVGYLAFDHPRYFMVMFAAARLGAVMVPYNFRLTGPELAYCINDSGAHTLIVGTEHVEIIDGVRDQLGASRFIHLTTGAPEWESLDALLAGADAGAVPAAVPAAADDLALIMYTSGTTGQPKGAMLTHGNFWTDNVNEIISFGLRPTDVTLSFAPLYHVGGLLCTTLATLFLGGHLVLQRGFDAGNALRAIEQHQISVAFGVPAMWLFISQHPDFPTADLSSLRYISIGGAPMPEPLLKVYQARGVIALNGYGLTESAAMTVGMVPEHMLDKTASCGVPPLLTEVRIIGEDGRVIEEPGVSGEICIRGGNIFKGYWNRPEETRAAFTDDGWFRSGDAGYFDDDGFLYVRDRVKDMVISGGENVYPAEVESVLYEHPAIAEVAVIGAPDDKWGERVVAIVAPKPGQTVTLDDIHAFAQNRLARYKLPRELRLVDALPRNPTGKVLKHRLREMQP